MAEFGTLNFSVAFNPTSAFPLDARSFFSSLAAAEAAAKTAKEVGSTDTVYYYGMPLVVVENNVATMYQIQPDNTLKEIGSGTNGGITFKTDETLSLENGVLKVNTAKEVQRDNTLPVTSAAVDTVVGNINILLETI